MNSAFQLHPLLVKQNLSISKSSGILRFRRTFEFKAGQVVNLSTLKSIPPRMYSIASDEKSEYIDILYKIVPEGVLTPLLHDLVTGDTAFLSLPFGNFLGTPQPAWYIATGTGIAPFLSMLRSGNASNKKLLHGSRDVDDFYFYDELKKQLNDRYIPCLTGKTDTEIYNGRVTTYLSNFDELPKDNKYYLCGSAEMVVETRDLLISKGIPFQHIQSEIYF